MSEECNECKKPIYPIQYIVTLTNISGDSVASDSYALCNDCYYKIRDKIENNTEVMPME